MSLYLIVVTRDTEPSPLTKERMFSAAIRVGDVEGNVSSAGLTQREAISRVQRRVREETHDTDPFFYIRYRR